MRPGCVTEEQVRCALALAKGHTPRAAKRFMYEMLLGQDRPWALLQGVASARKLAKRRKLHAGALETARGDLLEVTRRGARSGEEAALLLAFAIAGADAALSSEGGKGQGGGVALVAERLLALQLASGVSVQPFCEALLGKSLRGELYACIAAAALAEAREVDGEDAAGDALRVAYALWLLSSHDGEARAAQTEFRRAARSPLLRRLFGTTPSAEASSVAAALQPAAFDQPSDSAGQTPRPDLVGRARIEAGRCEGQSKEQSRGETEATEQRSAPAVAAVVMGEPLPAALPGRLRVYMRLLSGWALVHGLWRLLTFGAGLRRCGSFEIDQGFVLVKSETHLFGALLRSVEHVYAPDAWSTVTAVTRKPVAAQMVGLSLLALATYGGGLLLIDGAFLGHYPLLVVGGLVMGGGAACDGLLLVGNTRLADAATLTLQVAGRSFRLRGVKGPDAQRWVKALQTCRAEAEQGSPTDSCP